MAVSTYASLINRKLIIPSSKKPFLAVDEHFVAQLMLPLLERIHVDEGWYLTAYPDISAAIKRGVVPTAKAHYCQFGYYEHRMPYRILVDESWYLTEYPDVRDGVAAKHFASGQVHFELLGYKEGRFPFRGFDLELED